jgi:hypothetical protein
MCIGLHTSHNENYRNILTFVQEGLVISKLMRTIAILNSFHCYTKRVSLNAISYCLCKQRMKTELCTVPLWSLAAT